MVPFHQRTLPSKTVYKTQTASDDQSLFGFGRVNCTWTPARPHRRPFCPPKNHLTFKVSVATTPCPQRVRTSSMNVNLICKPLQSGGAVLVATVGRRHKRSCFQGSASSEQTGLLATYYQVQLKTGRMGKRKATGILGTD